MIKQNIDGTFEVSLNEQITIKITKSQQPYLAQVSDPNCADWDSVSKPNSLSEVYVFTVKGSVCSWCAVEAGFGFLKTAQGQYEQNDSYRVDVLDKDGKSAGHDIIPAAAGQSRPYHFHVSNI